MSEKFVSGGTTTWRDYVVADGRLVALHTKSGMTQQMRYFVLDHLGSVAVVTDETGAVTERLSYDAWGRHRHGADWTDDPTCSSGSATTTRGFTGQEEMDAVCDVNLNARVYDPTIGRFLSADSVTESVYDLQVLNPYSYVGNNPLSYSDPSGHCFLGCFWSSGIFRAVVAIVAAATLQAELADVELAASTTAELSPQLAVLNAGISGGVSGYITTGRLNGALLGSLEGVAFAGVHFAKSDLGVDTGTVGGALTSAGMHASVGGLFSMAGGGKFGSGFLAAGFSDLAGSATDDDDPGVSALDLSRHAVVGGIGSLLGGGKFANGAVTGAFGYLYNQMLANAPGSCNSPYCMNYMPHDDGSCSLSTCNDVLYARHGDPPDTSVAIGTGPVGVVDLNSDGTVYAGVGAGLEAKAQYKLDVPVNWRPKAEPSVSGDLLHFRFGSEPMGRIMKLDLGGGWWFGADAYAYMNWHGVSGGLAVGAIDGAGGSVTGGVRWRPH